MKLSKAQHLFSKEVSWNITVDFQPILSEGVGKGTKNVHPYMQFYFIEKRTKNLLRDWHD